MEVTEHARLLIADTSSVGEARRAAVELARKVGLSESESGDLALIATEAASNLVKHAGRGELLLRGLQYGDASGAGLIALDRGPGIASTVDALRDGFSTRGTPGTGLGAISRKASRFDLYSEGEIGVALSAQLWRGATPTPISGLVVDGICVPYEGEKVSGDAWAAREGPDQITVLIADGLGHGPLAAEASHTAVASFRATNDPSPEACLERIHLALRSTRGAAVSIARIDRRLGLVRFAGIGNTSATIVSNTGTRSLVSHHGTAGGVARRIRAFEYPWGVGDLLVMHSDGLATHWTLAPYPGLAVRDPALVAAVLYREHSRGRDDVSVVAIREAS
jgi:anti-sigma regulatory factor (Ser/Thr protein kinase)